LERLGVKYSKNSDFISALSGSEKPRLIYPQMPVRFREDVARFGMSARGGPRAGKCFDRLGPQL
jgi:hypothetical protein